MATTNIVQIGKDMRDACRRAAKAMKGLKETMDRLQRCHEFTHVSKYHR